MRFQVRFQVKVVVMTVLLAMAGPSMTISPPPASGILYPPSCKRDKACQEAFYKTMVQDDYSAWVTNVSADPFYTTPHNISLLKPGSVIRWDEVIKIHADDNNSPTNTTWAIPDTTSLSRFMFVSEDENGKPIASSAFALLPFSNTKGDNSPLPTVAWTHGTSGTQRQCGPSNRDDLWYSWRGPFFL